MSQSRKRKKNRRQKQRLPSSSPQNQSGGSFVPRFVLLVVFVASIILVAINVANNKEQPAARKSASAPKTNSGKVVDELPPISSPTTQDAASGDAPPTMPARDGGTRPPNRRRRQAKNSSLASQLTATAKIPTSPGVLSFTEHPIWAPTENETKARFVWGEIPAALRAMAVPSDENISNLRREDYAGADACKSCHPKNYDAWSVHPHRWMNAKADANTVLGDFSSNATIQYRGGTATFFMADGQHRMRLERDTITRVYGINRTIGSRFQQYYVGKLLEGPDRDNHPVRQIDFVLPFGYWLEKKEWVPVIHVDLELPDDQRHDPFLHPANRPYDRSCASCHTTQPAGDRLLRSVGRMRLAAYSPHEIVYDGMSFLQQNHPKVLEWADYYGKDKAGKVKQALAVMDDLPAEKHAAALGVTCEGCHNGAKFHAEHEQLLPRFYPAGQHVAVLGDNAKSVWGRSKSNLNWTCAQCHTGGRSMFACGASTWNSTEYSDAMRGSCYDPALAKDKSMSSLTCVHCHDPHEATGKQWKDAPSVDDQRCLSCHDQFNEPQQRLAHTHHPAGTSGDRCMNCHMPKINEGMQDVVRTHLIFSPTDPSMLEANHPNACNLCHLEEKIDWTLSHLANWYGLKESKNSSAQTESWKVYDDSVVTANYPHRDGPVGVGWLRSNSEATRLVAVESLAKADSQWALEEMLKLLDDPYLLNRQFAAQRLEEMLDANFRDFGLSLIHI